MAELRRPRPQAFQMEVWLLDASGPIKRTIEVPARLRVRQLHSVLQLAMGWRNYHLYEFRWGPYFISESPDGELYVDEHPDLVLDARQETLGRLGLGKDSLLTYLYDFGDNWVHAIRVTQAIYQPIPRPRVIAGEGPCPPEDVGGIGGYEQFLEAWADPEHEEHDQMVEWATGWYTPGAFDVAAADLRVAKKFPGKRASGEATP